MTQKTRSARWIQAAGRTLAGMCLAIGAAGTIARGDVTHGAFSAESVIEIPIEDQHLRNLVGYHLPICNPKLLVLTQCYGGDFLDDFAQMQDVAIASATVPGQQSHYNYFDFWAALGMYNQAGRTAQDLYNLASAHSHPLDTPSIGGGLPLANFPMDYVESADRPKNHILFYAGRPNDLDVQYYYIILELTWLADVVVVSSGALENESDYPATYDGLRQAFDAISGRMTDCSHRFYLFATDHGTQTFEFDFDLEAPSGTTDVTTPALAPEVALGINGTSDPHTYFVIDVPLEDTGITVEADGDPPLFASNGWSVSIPMPNPPSPLVLTQFTEMPVELGGDLIVGNDPDEGVRLQFEMIPQNFIDAFVGQSNTVTITNNTGQAWTLDVVLNPGAIEKVPYVDPMPGDLNCDGLVDEADIGPFVEALMDGAAYAQSHSACNLVNADVNSDGLVNGADASSFTAMLLGP